MHSFAMVQCYDVEWASEGRDSVTGNGRLKWSGSGRKKFVVAVRRSRVCVSFGVDP